MKILGIDPGTAVVGYGVIEGHPGRQAQLTECGVLRQTARASLAERLHSIHQGVTELLDKHQPDAVALEGIFNGKNVRTTVVLGHARGVILLAAEQAGVPVAEYAPATVKRTVVGNGRAAKAQVGYMVAQLLRLRAAPTPADAADGVALALTHLLRIGGTRPGRRALVGSR